MAISVENQKSKGDVDCLVQPTDVFAGKVWYNTALDRLEVCVDVESETWINESASLEHIEIDIEGL